eukprot:gene11945-12857_t
MRKGRRIRLFFQGAPLDGASLLADAGVGSESVVEA